MKYSLVILEKGKINMKTLVFYLKNPMKKYILAYIQVLIVIFE